MQTPRLSPGFCLVVCLLLSVLPALADPFTPGSVWRGTRHFKGHRGLQNWGLRITERQAETFSGIASLHPDDHPQFRVAVSGTAPISGNGPIRFKTAEKGGMEQRFFGQVKNGAMELEFRGDSTHGTPVEGTAYLSRKKG